MNLDRNNLNKIAHLARIKLNNDEVNQLNADMLRILDLIAIIEKANIDISNNIEQVTHYQCSMSKKIRHDEVNEKGFYKINKKALPKTMNEGFYLVPHTVKS